MEIRTFGDQRARRHDVRWLAWSTRSALAVLLAGLGAVSACNKRPSDTASGPATPVVGPDAVQPRETREEQVRRGDRLTEEEEQRVGPGNWRRAQQREDSEQLTPEQRAAIERLEALGYARGSRETLASGITRYEREAAQPGINLYTSGHAAEALLIDMEGSELHRWRYDFRDAFPDYLADKPTRTSMAWWCWIHLFDNGDLLALYSGAGIVKVNARSELLWGHRIQAHHDLAVARDGSIYVLTKANHMVPHVHETEPITEDFVTEISPNGAIGKSFSVLEAFSGTEFADAWRSSLESGDLLHTNAIEILDGRVADRVPEFKRGNLLLSIPKPQLVVVVDPETEKVVWARKFRSLHDVQIVGDGTLLVFDNRGAGDGSRALEMDPATMDILWEYRGDQEEPLRSNLMGGVQRLANGNTLVTESEGGRVIEVTPDGRIVWEFYTPHRAGDDGEFIASICRMNRLPRDFAKSFTSAQLHPSDAGP